MLFFLQNLKKRRKPPVRSYKGLSVVDYYYAPPVYGRWLRLLKKKLLRDKFDRIRKRKTFLTIFFFFRSLSTLKKFVISTTQKPNLSTAKKKKIVYLLKKIRLASLKLLHVKRREGFHFQKTRFAFSSIYQRLFLNRFRLHRYKTRRYRVIDFYMRRLRRRGVAYYARWNHYKRNRKFYRDLRDTYRFGKFGFVFLSLIWVFVIVLVLLVLPILKNILFLFFVAPVFSLHLFYEAILPFLVQTADNFFFFIEKILFLLKISIKMIYSIQLLPEIIILLAIFIIVCVQTWVLSYYNLRYFKKFIIASFGLEKAKLFFEKDRMASVMSNRLLQLKQLFVIYTFWDISLFCLVVSIICLLFTGVDFVTATNCTFFFNSGKADLLHGMNDKLFGSHFFYDSYTFYSRFFILLASIFFLLIFKTELNTDSKFQRIEFIILFLLGILFSMLMVSASSLLSLFLIIEGLVAIMYILTAGNFLETSYPVSFSLKFRSTEGSLKYLITNAVAGSFFLIGSIFLLYSTNGEIYFSNLHVLISTTNINSLPFFTQLGILLGLLCIAITFLFKIGSFPFYSWMVDLYESANLGILSFFILIPKMAILLTIINLQRFLFYHFPLIFFSLFFFCGLLSLIAGALLALKQNKMNRLLAYSSVNQIGSFLILLALTTLNLNISYLLPMIFVVAYSFVMLQFMSVLVGLKRLPLFSNLTLLQDLSFIKNLPVSVQTLFATFIFNLAGVPPFLGWLLKSLVVFTSIFLTFDIFFVENSNAYFLSILSNFELSFLTFFKEHILDIKTSFFSLNLSFSFLIVLSVIIFLALTVSVYYSLQLYKLIFFETKNVTPVHSQTPTYYTSLMLGTTIFVLFFFNIFLLFSVFDIFIWTLILCFF